MLHNQEAKKIKNISTKLKWKFDRPHKIFSVLIGLLLQFFISGTYSK